MSARARQLRKKLKEQKEAAKPKEEPKKEEENSAGDTSNSQNPAVATTGAKSPIAVKAPAQNETIKKKEEEKKKEEPIDPLDFFNKEHHEIKPLTGDKELNELLGIIEEDNKKVDDKKDDNNDEEESGSSSESDDGGMAEEQRLLNRKLAQQKLFSNKENRVSPTSNLFKPTKNKISEDMTKEVIMEKFGDDFDGAVELPELNEQKKQIMLKKMRKTINKLSSLRIQKHMDSELRHMIEDKIEDLKKIKGVNYSKIEGKVQELILSLKQPDFYFADDEDVHQITDVQEPYDIKPKTDIDFAFFMKQSPKTN